MLQDLDKTNMRDKKILSNWTDVFSEEIRIIVLSQFLRHASP